MLCEYGGKNRRAWQHYPNLSSSPAASHLFSFFPEGILASWSLLKPHLRKASVHPMPKSRTGDLPATWGTILRPLSMYIEVSGGVHSPAYLPYVCKVCQYSAVACNHFLTSQCHSAFLFFRHPPIPSLHFISKKRLVIDQEKLESHPMGSYPRFHRDVSCTPFYSLYVKDFNSPKSQRLMLFLSFQSTILAIIDIFKWSMCHWWVQHILL